MVGKCYFDQSFKPLTCMVPIILLFKGRALALNGLNLIFGHVSSQYDLTTNGLIFTDIEKVSIYVSPNTQ
jgi:hypothetical protein